MKILGFRFLKLSSYCSGVFSAISSHLLSLNVISNVFVHHHPFVRKHYFEISPACKRISAIHLAALPTTSGQ